MISVVVNFVCAIIVTLPIYRVACGLERLGDAVDAANKLTALSVEGVRYDYDADEDALDAVRDYVSDDTGSETESETESDASSVCSNCDCQYKKK